MNEIGKAINYWKEFKSEIKDLRRSHPTLDWNEQEKATDLAISALEKQIALKEKLKEYEDGHINVYELLEELKLLVDWSVEE